MDHKSPCHIHDGLYGPFSTCILVLCAYTGKGLGLTFFGTITAKLLSREDAVVTMIMFDFGNTVVPEPLFETSLSHDCFVCAKRDLVFNPNQTGCSVIIDSAALKSAVL